MKPFAFAIRNAGRLHSDSRSRTPGHPASAIIGRRWTPDPTRVVVSRIVSMSDDPSGLKVGIQERGQSARLEASLCSSAHE